MYAKVKWRDVAHKKKAFVLTNEIVIRETIKTLFV